MRVCRHCSDTFPDEAEFCPFDGHPLARPAGRGADPYLGRTLAARYRLIERVGMGGMAVVYLARHVMIERLSAIKILRQDLSLNPVHRERFLREARAVNRINHPNIVGITDFGEADGLVYLVMEYVAGESLAAPLRQGPLPWTRAARIASQIASALGRAHQMGVIHRDLKPDNVLLVKPAEAKTAHERAEDGADESRREQVKLTDFGIAKLMDAPALTFSEQLFGTPGYIPPEYLAGEACDGRADVYSLGVVLYEMLSARLPYDGETHAELLIAPLARPPVPLAKRLAGLPYPLETLVARMLARDPGDRPRDAFEVYDALSDLLKTPLSRAPDAVSVRVTTPSADGEIPYDTGPTMIDVPRSAASLPSSPGELQTPSEGSAIRASGMVLRWEAAVTELEEAIFTRSVVPGPSRGADRLSELAQMARGMLAHIRRIAGTVVEHQAEVDRIEANGRSFRASLGNAIDQLSLDRARERARLVTLRSRAESVGTGVHGVGGAAERAARAHEEDLAFQIATLQTRLDEMNERLERELWEAAGALEGGLAAMRHVHGELGKTLREATGLLTTGAF